MPTYARTQSIEHPIGERGRFELKVISADTDLRAVPGDTARVRATFELKAASDDEADRMFESIQLRVEREDGSLRVSERDEPSLGSTFARLFGGSKYSLDLTVEVPALADVRLDGVSADMRVNGLRGDQRYGTVSGDLYLTDLGGDVRLNSVSGDITVHADEPVAVRANSVSGDVRVTAPVLRGLAANAVSGDVELEGELAGGADFRVETVSGDLTVGLVGAATFEVRGLSTDINSDLDHRVEGRHDRRRLIVGSGGPQFLFSSMSGDIAVRRPRRAQQAKRDASGATTSTRPSAEDQLAVLQALERGEIDVDEATRRLSGGRTNG